MLSILEETQRTFSDLMNNVHRLTVTVTPKWQGSKSIFLVKEQSKRVHFTCLNSIVY